MNSKNHKIASIIVTYNRKNMLKDCLDSILEQNAPLNMIFIIDNNSNDGTQELLKKEGYIDNPKINYRKLNENKGSAGGFYE